MKKTIIEFGQLENGTIDVKVDKGDATDIEIIGMMECLKQQIIQKLAIPGNISKTEEK